MCCALAHLEFLCGAHVRNYKICVLLTRAFRTFVYCARAHFENLMTFYAVFFASSFGIPDRDTHSKHFISMNIFPNDMYPVYAGGMRKFMIGLFLDLYFVLYFTL